MLYLVYKKLAMQSVDVHWQTLIQMRLPGPLTFQMVLSFPQEVFGTPYAQYESALGEEVFRNSRERSVISPLLVSHLDTSSSENRIYESAAAHARCWSMLSHTRTRHQLKVGVYTKAMKLGAMHALP